MVSLTRSIVVGGVVLGLWNWLRRNKFETPLDVLEWKIKPGPWFEYYVRDWMEYHKIYDRDSVTSGIVYGAVSGDYIWATNTPEWDRDWFNMHGVEYPRKWVLFEVVESFDGEPGSPVLLPGL
jgi:hypothetical protein